jgi:hypothetical protein
MKDKLCQAFCSELSVRKVPAGLAVSTTFASADGDRIGFFVIERDGKFCIEDDGVMLPTLEASGVDFRSGTRGNALRELLSEYRVRIDDDDREFMMEGLLESEVPAAALRFVAFCLRVRDFMLMTEYRVATTFREDAAKMLAEVLGDRATLEENVPITDTLAEFPADFVLRAKGRAPVGVFLGMSDNRILEALFLQMRVRHEVKVDCGIVALLESGHSISGRVRQQALNRLDAVADFRGDELAAIQRVAREVIGIPHVSPLTVN